MAHRLYMLDTNMASYIIRGPSPALAARLTGMPMAQLCVSAITKAELLYGVARKPDAVSLQIAVREFLARAEVLLWDDDAAVRYGTLRAELEGRGKPLGNLDMLIAAHALASNSILVTNDKAFSNVHGLTVENWLVAKSRR